MPRHEGLLDHWVSLSTAHGDPALLILPDIWPHPPLFHFSTRIPGQAIYIYIYLDRLHNKMQ